jgi:hypothetical protein
MPGILLLLLPFFLQALYRQHYFPVLFIKHCGCTAAQHGAVGRSLRVYHSLAGDGYGKPSDSLCACGSGFVPAAH